MYRKYNLNDYILKVNGEVAVISCNKFISLGDKNKLEKKYGVDNVTLEEIPCKINNCNIYIYSYKFYRNIDKDILCIHLYLDALTKKRNSVDLV